MGEGARLEALEQAGWRVRYTRYAAAGARILPERLELTAGDVRLRLSVASWQFAP
jgi:outer membrane biogenesis lipoprotein LolB